MKVWFITGTSTGFGRKIAEHALEQGHHVVATARTVTKLNDLSEKYAEQVLTLPLDVTDNASISGAVEEAIAWKGQLDVVVNNAGIGSVGAVEELDAADYKTLFDTNVFGLVEVTRAVLPQLRKQKSGHIFNFSSVAGIVSMPGFGPYCATKHAVEALSEALAQEVGGLGIKVTIVEPGAFKTSFVGANLSEAPKIADYEPTVGPTRKMIQDIGTSAAGDPDKLAKIVIDVSAMEKPPLRLLLGPDAYEWATQKVNALRDQFEAHADLSKSTNFD